MGIVALLGSGEYTEAMLDVDRYLLSKLKDSRVLLFATAAAPEHDFMKWIGMGKEHFGKLGIEAKDPGLVDRKGSESGKIVGMINSHNFYCFSGGDPGYLLDTLKGTRAWEAILANLESGAVLAGSSAGAMVMGKTVWARVFDFHNNNNVHSWEDGLSVVPFGIIPHFDAVTTRYYTPEQVEQMMGNLPQGEEILGIDEDTAYIREGNTWSVHGKGKVHKVQGRP